MPRMHRFLGLLMVALALTAAGSQPAMAIDAGPAPELVIRDIGPGLVPLDGEWQFRLGDDTEWANPKYDDSQWEQIKADDTWGSQSHPSYTGFAWYRRHLDLMPAAVANQKLAILMPPVDDAYELFWNGQKIGVLGNLPPETKWFVGHRQSFALPIVTDSSTEGVLALRVWKAPLSSVDTSTGGGLNGLPSIGGAAAVSAAVGQGDFVRMRGSLYGRALSYFFLLTGALAFLAWMRDRNQKLFLWFAIWLLAKVALYYLSSDRVIELVSATAFNCSLLFLHSIVDCSVFLLLLYLFNLQDNRRLRRGTWIAIAVNLSFGLMDALLLWFWATAGRNLQWADGIFTAVFQLSELFVFVLVYQGLRKSLDLPRRLVAVMAFLVYLHEIVRILSVEGRRFTHWTLYEKMSTPLFHIFGAGITSRQILETTLILSVAYALICYAMEQRKHEHEIEMELKSAGEVQRIMIPEIVPDVPGYVIESVYRPALEAGGDFFQTIPLEDKSTLVVLGDVSGKGLKAAMNVSLIIGTLRALAEFNASPSSVLLGLNRLLTGRLQGGFVTALAFRIDELGNCSVANAGHLEPFLNGKELEVEGSLPLGIFSETEYEEQKFSMIDGDRLILYTDGVLEARNKQDELYGFERTRALLESSPSAEFIAETAIGFGQEDDITVLTIHRLTTLSASSQVISDVAIL
jgi:hypothetical protein